MLSSIILLRLLQISSFFSVASAFRIQYMLCSDDQEDFIKAAVAEARSLARAANQALDKPDVVLSESYEQWFGFANRGRELDIMNDNYGSLQILSGRLIRTYAPIHLTEIASGSIVYISVNASSGLCVHEEVVTFTNSEALPAPYSKFSGVLFLCPSFFALPITTRLLDQSGAGKIILHNARYINYIVASPQSSTLEATDITLAQPLNTSISCHSAFCCSNLDSSEKYRNIENSIKFALDAKYNPDFTQGNPCFTFEPAHLFQIQPRSLELSGYASSLLTSIFYQARSLQPRSVWICDHVYTSSSVSYSISHSKSLSVSQSDSMSVSYSVSLSISYSISVWSNRSTTETSVIPYTYTGTTANYTYAGTTVDRTYNGTTVDYTYIGTTVPYTQTATDTFPAQKRTNEPLISSAPLESFPGPLATGSSKADSDLEPSVASPTSFQHIITSKASTVTTSTRTCIATTTFPARSFNPAPEHGRNGYIDGSRLNQLLQQINLA